MGIAVSKIWPGTLAGVVALGIFLSPGAALAGSATNLLPASAIIPASSGTCSFDTAGPYTISFSVLNPLTPSLQTATVTFNVTCTGLTGAGGKTVVIDRVGSDQLYLKKGADQIPYSLNLPFSQNAVNNKSAAVTLTATIAGSDYATAPAGSYNDTITLGVFP